MPNLDPHLDTPTHPGRWADLSDREQQVLDRRSRGWDTDEIAADLGIAIKTVESHIASIKTKRHLPGQHRLCVYAVWHLYYGRYGGA